MFKKTVLIVLGLTLASSSVFASAKKFLDKVEEAFGKSSFVEIQNNPKNKWRAISFKNFNSKKFKSLKTKGEKKVYISNYLRLKDMVVFETNTAAFIVKSRDAVKQGIPVFKETIPEGTREQIVVLIKTLPKNVKASEIENPLRSLYSKDGDLKASKIQNKLIISDWVSNQRKIMEVINNL